MSLRKSSNPTRRSSTITGPKPSVGRAVECLVIQSGVVITMVGVRQLVVVLQVCFYNSLHLLSLVDLFANRKEQNGEACNS
jgi:hypothetical protein